MQKSEHPTKKWRNLRLRRFFCYSSVGANISLFLLIHKILEGVSDADGKALAVLNVAVLVEVVEGNSVERDVNIFGHFGGEAEVESVVYFLEVEVLIVGEKDVAGLEVDVGADVFVEFGQDLGG